MKFDFNRKTKSKMVGIILTVKEHKHLTTVAIDNEVSLAEAGGVLLRAALKEYK